MLGSTNHERNLYGENWNTVYGGYFSDPSSALPLVRAILEAAGETGAAAIADMGGGTGFLMSEVGREAGPGFGPRLVCVDAAQEQLDDCPDEVIAIRSTVEAVERPMLVEGGQTLLLCMRSLLHYFGREGLAPELAHLRSVLLRGERMVHQTICFEDPDDQAPANLLYERMGTGKWYPLVGELASALEAAGLNVVAMEPAKSLPLESAELEARYGIAHEDMEAIGRELANRWPGPSRVIVPQETGFTTNLDYMVMTCLAC